MIKEAIGEALTVEEATQQAKSQLNAPANADVTIEVIAMPAKKFLGIFGGSKAKVKAYYNDGIEEKKVAPTPKKSVPSPKPEKKAAPKATKETEAKQPAKPAKQTEVKTLPADFDTTEAVAYLDKMLKGLNVTDANITATVENGTVNIIINCEDYGIIIGRRGETLDSLQYLVSLVVNKKTENYVRVSLNVGNYREKREDTLRSLAKKNASHVLRSGRRVMLEPMNPYERRIIHTSIQEINGVTSRSVGSNNERKVIIELADGFKPTGGDRRGNGGYNRRPRNDRNDAPKSEAPRKIDKSELPKFGKIQ